MKRMTHKLSMAVMAVAMLVASAEAEARDATPSTNEPALVSIVPHPRLFSDAAGFGVAKSRLESSEVGRKALDALMRSAGATLDKPVLERKMEGRRLLKTSRTALERIGNLSFAWRTTGERKYADRAIAEAKAVAAFSDWNPSHFLDVGEMTLAVAVARDWLDDALDDADKRLLSEAILKKGLTKGDGKTLHAGWWTTAHNNWNPVCHGGLAAGAAAVREDYPEVAEAVLRRARKCLPIAFAAYEGGNFPEGVGYWSYASDFVAIALEVLSHQFADGVPELFAAEGLAEQGEYMDLMTSPIGLTFNFSDPTTSPFAWRGPDAANCYFGMKFGRGGGFAAEAARIAGKRGFGRFAAFALLWSRTRNEASEPEPVLCRSLGGKNPIAILRSGLNLNDWYVGVKGGTPSASHGHMDIGSFVLDAGGVRWACDLGCEGSGRIEAMKIDLWNSAQGSPRWSLFRLGVEGHGTLQIDGAQQKVDGRATFVRPVAPSVPSEAILDMTPVYPAARKAIRAFSLGQNGLLIRDRLAGLKPGAVVTWNMNTPAKATAQGNVLELEAKGDKGVVRKMTLAASPADVKWSVVPLDEPRTPADSPNPGISRVAFSVVADKNGDASLSVSFILYEK